MEKGQEINADFKKKKRPNSEKELKDDLIEPEKYQSSETKPNELESPEWPSREYVNKDKPSKTKH